MEPMAASAASVAKVVTADVAARPDLRRPIQATEEMAALAAPADMPAKVVKRAMAEPAAKRAMAAPPLAAASRWSAAWSIAMAIPSIRTPPSAAGLATVAQVAKVALAGAVAKVVAAGAAAPAETLALADSTSASCTPAPIKTGTAATAAMVARAAAVEMPAQEAMAVRSAMRAWGSVEICTSSPEKCRSMQSRHTALETVFGGVAQPPGMGGDPGDQGKAGVAGHFDPTLPVAGNVDNPGHEGQNGSLGHNGAAGQPGAPANFGGIGDDGRNGIAIGPNLFGSLQFLTAGSGDINQDGVTNGSDISAMLTALTDVSSYAQQTGLTTPQLQSIGDVNRDGKFSNGRYSVAVG